MENDLTVTESKRYYLLDAVRGICILGMIVYHTLFDLVAFYGMPVSNSFLTVVNLIRDFGASCFIFISGICIHFGHRPLKRSIFISSAGLLITIVTYIFARDVCIIFGILTFMGAAGFIMWPLKDILNKLNPVFGILLSFLLFLLFFDVTGGYLGFYNLKICSLPSTLYKNYFTAFLGFPFPAFSSGDYYPLLPWIFMFFCGFFFWNIIKDNNTINRLLQYRLKFFEKIGKYSLYIYILHQPIILIIINLSGSILNHI